VPKSQHSDNQRVWASSPRPGEQRQAYRAAGLPFFGRGCVRRRLAGARSDANREARLTEARATTARSDGPEDALRRRLTRQMFVFLVSPEPS